MSTKFSQAVVVVDGMDECGENVERVLDSFTNLSAECENLSVALFSRDEHRIGQRLHEADFEHIEVRATEHDIRLYVTAEVELRILKRRLSLRDPGLKDEIIEALTRGAGGISVHQAP